MFLLALKRDIYLCASAFNVNSQLVGLFMPLTIAYARNDDLDVPIELKATDVFFLLILIFLVERIVALALRAAIDLHFYIEVVVAAYSFEQFKDLIVDASYGHVSVGGNVLIKAEQTLIKSEYLNF